MTADSVQSSRGFVPAILLAVGIAVVQALIGGRRLLFCYPGLCLIAAAALIGIAIVSNSKARVNSLCLWGTAIFCGYILLRALFSPGYYARPDLFSIMGALLVYGLTVTAVNSSGMRLAVVGSLLTFALVHVLVGMVQFTGGENFMLIPFLQRVDYGPRASGFYVCPNHLAGLLEVVAIFGVSVTCWSRWPIWGKLLAAYATGACYVGLVLTGSRGGYLSGMASLLAFAVLSLVIIRAARPNRWLKLSAFGFVAFAALFLTATALIQQNGYLSQRAGQILDKKNMRVELWRAAIQQWQLQPILGTGAGTYRFYGRQFRTQQMQNDPIDVHNDYLHLLCEYGVVGFAAFLLFLSPHIRQGWRTIRNLAHRGGASGAGLLSNRTALTVGALCAVAAYIVHSAVDFNLHVPANAMLLAFVFGLLARPAISSGAGAPEAISTTALRRSLGIVAIILVIECARFFPGEYYAERARVALRDENPAASIALAKKALGHERKNPEVYFYLGRALVARAHQVDQSDECRVFYNEAIEAFKAAHGLAPLDGTYPLNLAFTYDEAGQFEDAERMYGVARSRDPRSLAVAQLYQAHRESWAKISRSAGQAVGL